MNTMLGAQPFPEGWLPPERREAAEALRRVEQERDQLAEKLAKLDTAWTVACTSREHNKQRAELAEAELASARQELDQLRARVAYSEQAADPYPDPSCGKHTGRASNRCLLPPGHPNDCDDDPPISERGVVITGYDAWSCLTPGGCGARYTRRTATTNHPCGELTPVRVSITHRTEGAPPE